MELQRKNKMLKYLVIALCASAHIRAAVAEELPLPDSAAAPAATVAAAAVDAALPLAAVLTRALHDGPTSARDDEATSRVLTDATIYSVSGTFTSLTTAFGASALVGALVGVASLGDTTLTSVTWSGLSEWQ